MLLLVATKMAGGEVVRTPAVSGAVPGLELASPPGVRLRELRLGAGLSLVELAHLMGREQTYYSHLSRLEHGRVRYPSLVLVADFLRACRASFEDVHRFEKPKQQPG